MMTESEEDPSEGIPQHLLNEDYALALYLQVQLGSHKNDGVLMIIKSSLAL